MAPTFTPKFPISYSLGYCSPFKTHVASALRDELRRLLRRHAPLRDQAAVLPQFQDGHVFTRERQNINEHALAEWYQICTIKGHCQQYHTICAPPDDILERVPRLKLLLAALREVAPTPRPPRPIASPQSSSSSSTSTPTHRHTRFGPRIRRQSPIPSPMMSLASAFNSAFANNQVIVAKPPRAVEEDIGHVVHCDDTTDAVPSATPMTSDNNMHYSHDGMIFPVPTNSMDDGGEEENAPVRNKTVTSISSSSSDKENDPIREGTVISISSSESDKSSSSDEPEELQHLTLGYPELDPIIFDVNTPVRLSIFINEKDKPRRMTVYPRLCGESGGWDLFLRDYHQALLRVGFNTEAMGEIYLPYSSTWMSTPWRFSIPITTANSLVFIRPYGLKQGHPNDVLDLLF